MKVRTIPFVLAGLIISSPLAAQTVALYEVSLDERIEKASTIVEGRVVSQSSFWDDQRHLIYTSNRVEVYRVFKGSVDAQQIDIVTYGGVVGYQAQVVHPELQLAPGDVGVFFGATPRAVNVASGVNRSLQFSPYASVQGFARYDELAGSASDVFHVYTDIVGELHARLIEKLGPVQVLQEYDPAKKLGAKTSQVPVITSFSPNPITAGNAAVLTINGTGFEAYGGAGSSSVVFFPNADDGGNSLNGTPDSEVNSWTDTRIEVRVPTRAGTGSFTVQTAGNSQGSSTTALTVDYNLLNVASQGFKRTILQAKDNGGYSLMMSTNTSNQGVDFSTSVAVAPFERALATWQQSTGFNMRNDGGTTTDNAVAPNDDPDIVMFDNDSNPLPAGTVGLAFVGYSSTRPFEDWYLAGVDIQFRRDGTGNVTWNFGPTATGFCCHDFETVALHELGHAHQLGHSISPGDAMHFRIANGTDIRTPNAVEIAGGDDVLDFSATKPNGMVRLNPVGVEDETPAAGGMTLSAAYPNPARGEAVFSVQVERTESITVEVFDVLGRRVMQLHDGFVAPGPATDFSVSARELPPGVYLYTVRGEASVLTRSLVLLR